MGVANVTSEWTSGNLIFKERVTGSGASIQFGEDDSGLDVVFRGDTSGASVTWDESEDALELAGGASIDVAALTSGITGKALGIGNYSTPVALGAVSEHYLGVVSHYSASIDDGSNMIPVLGKFTTAGACSSAVAQGVYGFVDVDHAIADAYGVRGRVSHAASTNVSQLFGVFGTLDTGTGQIGTSGMIAGLASEVSGSGDLTTAGYGKVCGAYISWKESNAMTADTVGVYIANHTGMKLDSGILVGSQGDTTSLIETNGTGNITNLFKFDAASGCVATSGSTDTVDTDGHNSDGSLKIDVNGTAYYIPIFNSTHVS